MEGFRGNVNELDVLAKNLLKTSNLMMTNMNNCINSLIKLNKFDDTRNEELLSIYKDHQKKLNDICDQLLKLSKYASNIHNLINSIKGLR